MPFATPDHLAGLALFEPLDDAQRAAIAPWFELQDASPGVRLTGEGASGYSFFILRDGSASVSVGGAEVRTLGPGDFFGERAILGGGMRTATVTTTSPSRLLVLFGTEFRQLEQEYPELAARIQAGVRERGGSDL